MDYSYLDENIASIKSKISAAAQDVGRDADDVLLMVAIKSADVGQINYIHNNLGINHVGENRVQQLLERWDKLDRENLNMHFIGSLQTNKVKYIIDKVCLIHSLDSERLAREIDKQAKRHGLVMRVLCEVNSGQEESKGGIAPAQVYEFCKSIEGFENIELCGFMTMAPRCEDKTDYHKYFSATRELCMDVWYNKLGKTQSPILSMGMSDSFEEAVQDGSNLVRVGHCVFESKKEN